MALNTYTGLKAAIKNWLQADELDAFIDDFIDLAEARMNRELRLLSMERRATISTASQYTVLPTGFIEMRNLQINDSPVRSLEYMTPEKIDTQYDSTTTNTVPRAYTIVGGEIQLAPPPSQSYTLEMAYYKSLDPIDASTSNDVLLNAPDVYLYGTLAEASAFLYEDARAGNWLTAYKVGVVELNRRDEKARYSGSALRIVFDKASPP